MDDPDPIRVPTYERDGVIAYALVDARDARLVEGTSWNCVSGRYAMAKAHVDGVQRTIYMHRVIMGLGYGDERSVDHINGDVLDNRRQNLRVVSHAENMQNTAARRTSTSRYRGVSRFRNSGRWRAQATVSGRNHYLGIFDSELEAAKVCARFRAEHMTHSVEDPSLLT